MRRLRIIRQTCVKLTQARLCKLKNRSNLHSEADVNRRLLANADRLPRDCRTGKWRTRMPGDALLSVRDAGVILASEPHTSLVDKAELHQRLMRSMRMARLARLPVLDFRQQEISQNSYFLGPELLDELNTFNRSSLIICGGLLEGAVTQISLTALMNGLDVFVVQDLVSTSEPHMDFSFLSRITACGGHALTYRQTVLELLASQDNPESRSKIERLLR